MAIAERLRAQRFFVTGATGFLGTALVERILRAVPDSHVTVCVRPTRRSTPAERAEREILKNDCFDRLRQELGADFSSLRQRLVAVGGDVGTDGLGLDDEGWAALEAADIVIHSAATVSFDSPLDQAVEINLLGPLRVATAVAQARASARAKGHGGPAHLIAVSTAYVAGTHQGEAPEQLLSENRYSVEVDWNEEVAFARQLRTAIQNASRSPQQLSRFAKDARKELGSAGEHVLARRAERLREDWIKDQLIKAGTTRAQSLGWPDAYPYTKALGERAVIERFGPESADPVPISIVRPSIIESALSEPVAGWIRGFRMAEPIIVSYARGLLHEFPGVAEGVTDVVPVDLVVAAILAVAARGPQDAPSVTHVASGVANPLRYGHLVDLVRDYFSEHPVYDDRGQPISVPPWTFSGTGGVQSRLQRATKVMEGAQQVINSLPVRGNKAAWSAKLEEQSTLARRALAYVELYGMYAQTEARYRVDALDQLWADCDETDRTNFCFNPRVIDWDRYVIDVHLPSVVSHARLRMTPARSVTDDRKTRATKAILSPERQLAVFDLEHTLVASNVVDSYAWFASRHLNGADRVRFVARLVAEGPQLLAMDRRDRGDFLRTFYRRYEGADQAQLQRDGWEHFHDHLMMRSFPMGFARVREHQRLGHRTLLITGALDFIIEPLAPLFDDIVCAHLIVRNGVVTGQLDELPPIGEARGIVLADYARRHNLNLAEAVGYADSASDLPLLEAVGFPVAVNPEARLAAIARRRGWHVEQWDKAGGGAQRTLPLGPLDRLVPSSRRPGVLSRAPGGRSLDELA